MSIYLMHVEILYNRVGCFFMFHKFYDLTRTWRTYNIIVSFAARAYLLNLSEYMEKNFLECINEAPNRRKWDILSDGEVRVLKDVTMNHVETQGSSNYIALTSFRIQAKPFSVVQFLLKNNIKLQVDCCQNNSAKLLC